MNFTIEELNNLAKPEKCDWKKVELEGLTINIRLNAYYKAAKQIIKNLNNKKYILYKDMYMISYTIQ